MSADDELGYVYLPVSSTTHNHYGGERPGANLFSQTLVCLKAATGERVWHYQLIHHGLWNYDPPAPPVLADIKVAGKAVKALALVSKQAFCYVLDRTTGEPVWPIDEREVPQSKTPGEQSWPTQPFPSKPAPYDRQGLQEDDLIDFTPELREKALAILQKYEHGPLFTPPSEKGTLVLPGGLGRLGLERRSASAQKERALRAFAHRPRYRVAGKSQEPARLFGLRILQEECRIRQWPTAD